VLCVARMKQRIMFFGDVKMPRYFVHDVRPNFTSLLPYFHGRSTFVEMPPSRRHLRQLDD
jgi:hypothetical protein